MKFSIILCTVDRTTVIVDFLESLLKQSYKNFELIVVDQNLSDDLLEIIRKFEKHMCIKYIHSSRGLSRSRNVGMLHASGDILCFPDDDCTYPSELLENINVIFMYDYGIDFLLGKTIDSHTGKIIAGKNIINSMYVKCNYFGGSSTNLFINIKFEHVHAFSFDERFGIGATFHAEEENDLIIRMLKNGKKGVYIPKKNYVYHPDKDSNYYDLKRASKRGYGFGALVAKHIYSICGMNYFFRYFLIRVPASILVSIIIGNFSKSRFNSVKYMSMWKGFYFYISQSNKT